MRLDDDDPAGLPPRGQFLVARDLAMDRSARAWMPVAGLVHVLLFAQPTPAPAQDPAPSAVRRPATSAEDLPSALPGSAGAATSRAEANPLATGLKLREAPFDAGDVRFPINLATALRLSDARPLV